MPPVVLLLVLPGPATSDAMGGCGVTVVPAKEVTIKKRSAGAQGCLLAPSTFPSLPLSPRVPRVDAVYPADISPKRTICGEWLAQYLLAWSCARRPPTIDRAVRS